MYASTWHKGLIDSIVRRRGEKDYRGLCDRKNNRGNDEKGGICFEVSSIEVDWSDGLSDGG